MKNHRVFIRGIAAACAMLVIIFDTRIAITSARDGVALCIQTIIPSLFPFFMLTGIINSCLMGLNLRFLQPLGRLCKIPKGADSLLILGMLAGYPIGAQLITQAYKSGNLPQNTALRMLGFCCNAGPAFLFGILSPLFSRSRTVWILWSIHILSALITGFMLPAEVTKPTQISSCGGISFQESLQRSVKAMAGVCGWVILFRIVLGFCNRWFLWLFPTSVQVLLSGLLELSNGCILLQNVSNEGMRFLLAGAMLSFGGLCVGMQTMSVTEGLGTGWYFPGKVLQTALTLLLSIIVQPVLFRQSEAAIPACYIIVGLPFFILVFMFLLRRKK